MAASCGMWQSLHLVGKVDRHERRDEGFEIGRFKRHVQLLSSSKGEFAKMPPALRKAPTKIVSAGCGRRLAGSKTIIVIAGTWLDNTAQVEVNLPLPQVWDLWNDREKFTRWMPWISSVKVFEDKPELSRWTLKYDAFGQSFEFSWVARNLQPIYRQKIHWRSVDGLPNRGTVRFYPRGPSSCGIQILRGDGT